MISNPANPFINGNDRSPFTYEPGAHPYHLCTVEAGLTSDYSLNCIVFANTSSHAKQIYIDMIQHMIDGMQAYVDYRMSQEYAPHPEVFNRTNEKIERYKNMKEVLEIVDEAAFERVQTNHPIKVGWASNDTFV